jgi:hypothetical protein
MLNVPVPNTAGKTTALHKFLALILILIEILLTHMHVIGTLMILAYICKM